MVTRNRTFLCDFGGIARDNGQNTAQRRPEPATIAANPPA
jgi:hypothetical protein